MIDKDEIMRGAPPPGHLIPPRADWDRAPWNRWSFQHMREIVPTVEVRRGEMVLALPDRTQNFDALVFDGFDQRLTVSQWLDESFSDGFIVLHKGAIAYERYFNRMQPHTLHLSQSVAKSVVGAAAGVMIGHGALEPERLITDYVPELGKTAYRGATIRHVMDMTSGVYFSEEYTDPFSEMGQLDVAAGWKEPPDLPGVKPEDWPRDVFSLILKLTRLERPHGETFVYRSIETDILAFAMERIAGKRLNEIVTEHVWSKIGAERDGCFTVDRAGYALADGGFNATLRDYARFGEMIRNHGRALGQQVVPKAFIDDIQNIGPARFDDPYTIVLPKGGYRNQFWLAERGKPMLMCRGVFGQLIVISPEDELVAVKLSTWPDFVHPKRTLTALAAIGAIAKMLASG
jgi:CubicO group peptidase (beta-lactamase class C family)